jgi:hypothetical protein
VEAQAQPNPSTGDSKHRWQSDKEIPWRRRPRRPLRLRDPFNSRIAVWVVCFTLGPIVEGLNLVTGSSGRTNVWLGSGMLLVGVAATVVAVMYALRPPRR